GEGGGGGTETPPPFAGRPPPRRRRPQRLRVGEARARPAQLRRCRPQLAGGLGGRREVSLLAVQRRTHGAFPPRAAGRVASEASRVGSPRDLFVEMPPPLPPRAKTRGGGRRRGVPLSRGRPHLLAGGATVASAWLLRRRGAQRKPAAFTPPPRARGWGAPASRPLGNPIACWISMRGPSSPRPSGGTVAKRPPACFTPATASSRSRTNTSN